MSERIHATFISDRPCLELNVVGFSTPLRCEIDTAGLYHLLIPWPTAWRYKFSISRPVSQMLLINSYPMTTQNGLLEIWWDKVKTSVPTRVYGDSSPVFTRIRPPRPSRGIDGYIGSKFFQADERLTLDYTQGNMTGFVDIR